MQGSGLPSFVNEDQISLSANPKKGKGSQSCQEAVKELPLILPKHSRDGFQPSQGHFMYSALEKIFKMIKFIRKERKKKNGPKERPLPSSCVQVSTFSKDLMCVGKLNKGMWEGRNHPHQGGGLSAQQTRHSATQIRSNQHSSPGAEEEPKRITQSLSSNIFQSGQRDDRYRENIRPDQT